MCNLATFITTTHYPNNITGFWLNRHNGEKFLTWLGKKLEFKTIEDWYKLTASDFER